MRLRGNDSLVIHGGRYQTTRTWSIPHLDIFLLVLIFFLLSIFQKARAYCLPWDTLGLVAVIHILEVLSKLREIDGSSIVSGSSPSPDKATDNYLSVSATVIPDLSGHHKYCLHVVHVDMCKQIVHIIKKIYFLNRKWLFVWNFKSILFLFYFQKTISYTHYKMLSVVLPICLNG